MKKKLKTDIQLYSLLIYIMNLLNHYTNQKTLIEIILYKYYQSILDKLKVYYLIYTIF